MSPQALDLVGDRYGRLTVVSRAPNSGSHGRRWNCACECGGATVASVGNLRSGAVESCGCAQREAAARSCRARSVTHGMTRTRLYTIWRAMKARCERSTNVGFSAYGGRGISVCAEWSSSFEAFKAWAESNGYYDDLSIDRVDVNGNYEPANCRWATPKQQSNNRRSSKLLTIAGETRTLQQWSDASGLKAGTILYRIGAAWPPSRILEPLRGRA